MLLWRSIATLPRRLQKTHQIRGMSFQEPKIVSSTELPASEAKWVTLQKIKWTDQEGKERLWECASRKTRNASGVDAVAVLAILKSKTNAFPVSTVVIEQYRPPIGKYIIELPAGLIDAGESAEQVAIRELREETGYEANKVVSLSPVIVSDPGMSNANMILATVDVLLEDKMETPKQHLEPGEHIVTRVVELDKLQAELEEFEHFLYIPPRALTRMGLKGFVVDARLSHFAVGYALAKGIL